MQRYLEELGQLNQICNRRCSEKLEQVRIFPSYKAGLSSNGSRGAISYIAYDPWHTCFRGLPNSTRYFQASLRNNLITNSEADDYTRRLVRVYMAQISKYKGRFSQELNEGRVGQIISQLQGARDYTLYEADGNLAPDDIYAALPWPCIPAKHFGLSSFAAVTFNKDEICANAKSPLKALTSAADFVYFGPSINLSTKNIMTVLDWLENGDDQVGKEVVRKRRDLNLEKINVSSLTYGLQGIVSGSFFNLLPEHKPFVEILLREFADTIGEKCAWVRRQDFLETIKTGPNLAELARAFIGLLPPIQHLAVRCGAEICASRLHTEEDYLAGYELMGDDEAAKAIEQCDSFVETNIAGRRVELFFTTLPNCVGLDPVFASLRAQAHVAEIAWQLRCGSGIESLTRSELQAVQKTLQQHIGDSRGEIAACRNLYLFDSAYRRYQTGEVVLSNHRCREFMRQRLQRDVKTGFHISGKATKKYESDIGKLLHRRFVFESDTAVSVRVRWNPLREEVSNTARLPDAEYSSRCETETRLLSLVDDDSKL